MNFTSLGMVWMESLQSAWGKCGESGEIQVSGLYKNHSPVERRIATLVMLSAMLSMMLSEEWADFGPELDVQPKAQKLERRKN
ncbi:hypothetical protein HJG54_30435 [Leptolyngbya sp. NK1-12]|uniref:Uncharacterized protein n=1 Tax=Leptolyngbya sp. NK1-12 TaxID=2547451 RepID=A0AA96WKZ3_9CYAN|nr:hypothetical protein [Leptolyngbya sp. NK1-12]WNZ27219.1 hypothetical protein HJG54_30435 [Leptolyngbya sp. NK1-12]